MKEQTEQENRAAKTQRVTLATIVGAAALAGGFFGAGVASRDQDIREPSRSIVIAAGYGTVEYQDRDGDDRFDMRIDRQRVHIPNPYCGSTIQYLIDRDVQKKLGWQNLLVDQCVELEWTHSGDRRFQLRPQYEQ